MIGRIGRQTANVNSQSGGSIILLLGGASNRAQATINTKVVLIDKVVLGSPKKGDGNWQYFWVQVLCRQHLWVQKFEEKSGKFKIQIYIFAGL